LNNKKTKTALIALPIIAVFAMIIGVALGSVYISPDKIISVISNRIFNTALSENVLPSDSVIIWQLRMPRVALAFLIGGALSASGAVVQSVLKNPLASPFTLGVSSGASLGAGVVIAFSFSIPFLGYNATLILAALAAGLVSVYLCILFASKIDKSLQSTTIVLCGMVFSMFINAMFTLLASFSGDKMQQILKWQLGTFSAKGWEYAGIMLVVLLICLIVLSFYSSELDILTFGEEQATAMGVETKKVKWILLIVSSVLTGCSVAFVGVIGFVDLIVPHIVRRMFTSRHKYLIPLSAIIGGILMIVVDLTARTIISPRELGTGIVTSLIGAPFFAYVYFKGRKK